MKLNGDTAGTGGITGISGHRAPDGSLDVRITGELRNPLDRTAPSTPNFNKGLPTGSSFGLPDYEIAHLWGPGFGDEAADGLMYAPREVNQALQNSGIESRLRELHEIAAIDGGTITVTARAVSHPPGVWDAHKGGDFLSHASYHFEVNLPGEPPRVVGEVDIWVPPPGSHGKATVEVTGGSAGVWSLE